MSCAVAKPVAGNNTVEVRYVTETVHDTAVVELPVVIEHNVTLDTVSQLENAYAKSEAVVSAGVLRHSLQTKPVKLPVSVEKKIIYRDSIRTQEIVVPETVEVEKPLTFWQRVKLKIGGLAIVMTLLFGLYVSLKIYLNH
ncbi:MAG: hypothetical protein IJR25_02065 [Bacteroidales bacterium]|nr:hypothetical protein [Bacteroidales bacterium]